MVTLTLLNNILFTLDILLISKVKNVRSHNTKTGKYNWERSLRAILSHSQENYHSKHMLYLRNSEHKNSTRQIVKKIELKEVQN